MIKRPAPTLLATALAGTFAAGSAQAADEPDVAYFLEWATPNMIAKVDGA